MQIFTVPSSIGVNSIAITVKDAATRAADASASPAVLAVDEDRTTIPEDVSVSGEKLFITIGDLNKDRTGGGSASEAADFSISNGSTISVVIRESAGVSNPSAAGDYGPVIEIENSTGGKIADYDWEAENDDGDPEYPELTMKVFRVVSLDEEDGGLGTVVTVTGKGFRKSTSMIVFVDHPSHQDDDNDPDTEAKDDDDNVREIDTMVRGTLDLGEDVLCTDLMLSAVDSIGSPASSSVTHPTFEGGINYINAVDGRNGYIKQAHWRG